MTSEPWNEFDLIQPVIATIGVKNSTLDLKTLRKTLDQAILYYESPKDLEESAAFCSRLLARRRNSFRSLSGFRELRKANSALCRLLRLNIITVLRNFRGTLPDFVKTNADRETQLPSQELFDYLLLRMIALQKLYNRITDCCLNSATYFTKLLHRNYFFDIITVILSTIARIRRITEENAIRTAKYYSELVKHRSNLPLKMQPLCPEFVFPVELEARAKTDRETEIIKLTDRKQLEVLALSDDEQDTEKTIELDDSPSHKVTMRRDPPLDRLSQQSNVDLGVVISRNAIEQAAGDPKGLKTLESILQFVRDEEVKRRNSLSHCVSKNVTHKHWKLLKKKLSQMHTNDNRSAVKLFRKTMNIS